MPTYHKLIRDRIPQIIEKSGKSYRTEILNAERYEQELRLKLQEEMNEVLNARSRVEILGELADLVEVIHAFGDLYQLSPKEIEAQRQLKFEERGGFEKRIYLVDVED
ncbi:nucleoside triphosphate pyrophosphohydrolase [Alkalihalophilus pseudofirmus]|jgi:predicted house-cleaning noncanonical NTP pyrophosphatase (MazG superfamily)|uniref:Nucleoside triphosphate pyrophosphohydrolase n=1 Tax=Alkalihalophilus pseudofirmus TaxID=79885 RepID=A0AAJ2NKU5_ALKPS|nr:MULTISPECIES: nucleoside triphosphate pyrophosphohydrolase [Alkalihalophilus]MCM3491156.1 nucleoside triphosphate pyrophosphohydrolase [Alkalihalophilus marmarensis]MDV2884676.1 nucleoside triphosphate pyrophosphohydrolase [Alkalihalophilus pseudofirmus]